jgi:hypothetical protein
MKHKGDTQLAKISTNVLSPYAKNHENYRVDNQIRNAISRIKIAFSCLFLLQPEERGCMSTIEGRRRSGEERKRTDTRGMGNAIFSIKIAF